MKTLYLVRHAKSSWTNAHLSDHDRPLNNRGERDAPRMGQRLRRRTPLPEVIISSSAVRAKTTARILADEMGYVPSAVMIDKRLYDAEPNDVLAVLADLEDVVDCAMLVGHNPTFTALVNAWGNVDIENMPTCSVAVLTFSSDSWKNIGSSGGKLQDFDFPKNEHD